MQSQKDEPQLNDEVLIIDRSDGNFNKRSTINSLPIREFLGPWTGTHNAGAQQLNNVGSIVTDATNPATAGQIRLGNTQSIQWRNAENDDNASLTFDALGKFVMNRGLSLNTGELSGIASFVSAAMDAADVGTIRLGNGQYLSWRNSTNDGNHQLVFVNDSFRMDFATVEEYSFTTGAADWNNNGITDIGRSNFNQLTVPYNATQSLDFDSNQYRQITLTGDLTTLSTVNRAAGKIMTLVVIGDSVNRTLTFNSSWHTNPSDPSIIIGANSRVVLSFYCAGTSETDVIVAAAGFV